MTENLLSHKPFTRAERRSPFGLPKGPLYGLLIAIVFLTLALIAQPHHPEPWFDEGLNLSTAEQLAKNGLYALPSSDGARVLDPAIQTGPTVLLPIAAVFKLFGSGILQARVFMAILSTIVLLFYFMTARYLHGSNDVALVASVLLLLGAREPYGSYLFLSRQALGEAPALGFLLGGVLLLWKAIELSPGRARWLYMAAAGLCWGLAAITKSQLLIILPVALAALTLLDMWHYKKVGFMAFVVAGLCAAAVIASWYAAQIAIVGLDQFQANAAILREGFSVHIVSFSLHSFTRAAGVIWRSGWLLMGPASLLWSLWYARRSNSRGFQHATVLFILVTSLFWYVFLSIGWSRYAFYPIVLTPLLAAGALTAFWSAGSEWMSRSLAPAQRWVIMGAATAILVLGGSGTLVRFENRSSDDFEAMRDVLATLPQDAVIETWEWDIAIDMPNQFHYPPTPVTNAYTEQTYFGVRLPANLYNPCQFEPDYLLVGPFGSWTGIYADLTATLPRLAQNDSYALYRFEPASCTRATG